MDFALQKTLYNRCDPLEPLPPDDARNVDLDQLGDPDHRVRGERWIEVIESQVRLAERPVRILFSGLLGSGKSTELLRLAVSLARPDACNLLPVVANADEFIDLSAEIDVPDILLMMLAATERAVLAAEAHASGGASVARMWTWLTEVDPSLRTTEFGVAEAAQLAAELRSRDALRQRVRDVVARNLSAFRREVTREFEGLCARARGLGRAGIVVVIDALEKLHGTGASFWTVLTSARSVFTNGAPHLELPVHAVYTVPSALLRLDRFDNVHFLPMIKVTERAGVPCAEGRDACRRIIERRVPRETLRELFGARELDARLDEIIRWSGGYPRELITLLRTFIRVGAQPIGEREFQRVIRRQGDEVRRPVPDYAFEWLARVATEKRLPMDRDDDLRLSQQMLQSNVVLRYLNEVEWFDLHPAVTEIPGVGEATRRAEARRGEAP